MKFATVFIVCSLFVVGTIDANIKETKEWQSFKSRYGKNYATKTEDDYRMKIYMKNQMKIEQHNRDAKLGKFTFTLEINKYADLLHEEFLQIINLNNNKMESNNENNFRQTYRSSSELLATPDAVDWRDSGCVRDPIDQGLGGCPYPFVSTGALEGQWCAKHKTLTPISEQNLLDCVGNCENGSLPSDAFQYCVNNGGVDTEESYPYTGHDDDTCNYTGVNKGVICNGVVNIPQGNESVLQEAVGNEGPVSVAIDASQPSFQYYSKGVYYEANCSSEYIDHLLLVVGYNTTEDGQDYWIARNSWGTNWGDNGYVLLSRNRDNNCGVATLASYPKTAYCSSSSGHPC